MIVFFLVHCPRSLNTKLLKAIWDQIIVLPENGQDKILYSTMKHESKLLGATDKLLNCDRLEIKILLQFTIFPLQRLRAEGVTWSSIGTISYV